MKHLKNIVVGLALSAAACTPVDFSKSLKFREVTTSFAFIDKGQPGRSTEDVLTYTANLLEGGSVAATKTGTCTTTLVDANGDFFGECVEKISFTPDDTIDVKGVMNQSALERFVAQTIPVTGGTGVFAGVKGEQIILQVVYPDQFDVTLTLRK